MSSISFEVAFRGDTHRVSLPSDDTVSSLRARLEELTQVPPSAQKLLFRGKKIGASQEGVTLAQAGLRDGIRVQMLGSTTQELDALHSTESEHHKKERILRERALKPQFKARLMILISFFFIMLILSATQYRFHKLEPLSHLPDPSSALARLSKLANDPAIQHIMQQHKFSVGLLTELAPHESPGLLGLNVGVGQAIKLRIRTDAYDGFRPYLEVRRVLCHELAHNVWSEHDNNGAYQPSSNEEGEAFVHVLGGNSTLPSDSIEDRRRRALEAATSRLKKQEEELEQSCGTTRPPNAATGRRH
ncbi:WLM-domain-containing protein, partial [Pisolithus sp. B1]